MSVIKRLLDIGYHLHLLIVTTAARRRLLTPTFILAQLATLDKSDQFVGTTLFVSRHWVAVVTMTAKSVWPVKEQRAFHALGDSVDATQVSLARISNAQQGYGYKKT